MQDSSEIFLDRKFDSYSELSDLSGGWGADFRQLSAERFPSEIFQGRISSLLLSNGKFGCHVDQRGTTPGGMRTFAVPNANCPEFRWFGQTVDASSLLLFPLHGEIECSTRPGFNVFTFSIPMPLLEGVSQWAGLPEAGTILGASETVVPLSRGQIYPLRKLLRQTRELARLSNEQAFGGQVNERIHNQLVLHSIELFSRNNISAISRLKNKHRALAQVLAYIDAHRHTPLRVSELCEMTDVSLRTIQALFKQELGMTLKTYLAGQRLYGVHRELWAANPNEARVSIIAAKWGFWHMSQFSSDYRKLFGELPSITLARNTWKKNRTGCLC